MQKSILLIQDRAEYFLETARMYLAHSSNNHQRYTCRSQFMVWQHLSQLSTTLISKQPAVQCQQLSLLPDVALQLAPACVLRIAASAAVRLGARGETAFCSFAQEAGQVHQHSCCQMQHSSLSFCGSRTPSVCHAVRLMPGRLRLRWPF